MSRLHKITNFPLTKKIYLTFMLLIGYGIYKNGLIPYINEYSNIIEFLKIILIPFISLGIGALFDKIYNNKNMYSNSFYSLLFCMIIPYETNIILYLLFLVILLFLYNYLEKMKIDSNLNIIAVAKLLLILITIIFKNYTYKNPLESSALFQYSFIDSLMGHNISGIFTSNVILIFMAFFFLCSDEYYKKDISINSYGIYLLTLLIYTFISQDITFLLRNMFSSNVLFGLVFVATLSCYTPYQKKHKFIYNVLIGGLILPLSLLVNFFEGIYISIVLANLFLYGYKLITENNRSKSTTETL